MIKTSRHWDRVRAHIAVVAVTAGAGTMALAACAGAGDERAESSSAAAITITGGAVHGYAAVMPAPPRRGLTAPEIGETRDRATFTLRRPGVSTYLKDPATGRLVGPKVATDAHGRYALPPQAPGDYLLCIEGFGVTTSCSPITLTQETYNPPGERVLSPTGGVVWGNVLLADGTPCYHENAGMGGVLTTTKVSLVDEIGRNVTRPVIANDRGQYLLSGITGSGAFTLRAECAGSAADRTITLDASFGGSPFDLTFADHSPIAVSIIGKAAGVPVRHASAGDVVEVTLTAHDPDGDPLHYRWSDGTTGLASVDAPAIQWRMPSLDATAILFVEVSDGRGGFARANLAMSTTTAEPLFSGTVVADADGKPLGRASVSINGKSAVTTDDLGRFHVRVPESPRYAINATLPRFALASRIYYGPATGVVLRMAATERTICDPRQLCTAHTSDVKTPVRVVIAPNTLVGKRTGKAPPGPVSVDIASFDLSRTDAMPGDFSAQDRSGRAVALISSGAVNVDISDEDGNQYTIARGNTARLSIPVDPVVLARRPPAQIPLWEYDEAAGMWREKAAAKFNAATATFDGEVPGFSAWNADTVFTDDACIRFTMDPKEPPPFPFILHVSYPLPSGPVRHNDFTITENVNGLFRLRADVLVTLEVHPASGPDAVLSSLTVNSGPKIDPRWGGFPPFDFTECHGFDPASPFAGKPVRLALGVPKKKIAPWLSPSLSSPFGVGGDDETRAYYNAIAGVTIDPTTNACTPPAAPALNKCALTGFQTANGFAIDYATTSIPAPGEIVTYFYNAGDLGLGREMHCKKTGSNVACYVTNYGVPPAAEPIRAIADAIGHSGPIATVAMEYDAAAPALEQVRFYVYPAGGTLALAAALDSEGLKNVPQVCIACHGGVYNGSSHKARGAAFREFDVHSYLYDATTWTLSNQQENFRRLNEMVKSTGPNSVNTNNPIGSLIDRMYDTCGGVSNPGCVADTTDLPPKWDTNLHNRNLYNTIIKPYCRACHVAQSTHIDFMETTNFTDLVLEQPVCTNHDMPHGEVPFRKFWLSTNPSAPEFLADATTGVGIAGGCPR